MGFFKKSLLLSTSLLCGIHGVWAMEEEEGLSGKSIHTVILEESNECNEQEKEKGKEKERGYTPNVSNRNSSSKKSIHPERIKKLKELFKKKEITGEKGIDGFIIPHNDEYQSEDLPKPNKRLKWLTGFTGSRGIAVVETNKSAIFVDGRYTTQARNEVPEDFSVEDYSNYQVWLKNNMKDKVIGYDPRLYLYKDYNPKEFEGSLTFSKVKENLVDQIWGSERPSLSVKPIDLYPEEFSGESAESKIVKVRKKLEEDNIDVAIILDLDSIAWLLNIRGSDLPYTPVVLSSLLLDREGNLDLIIAERKLDPKVQDYFSKLHVTQHKQVQFKKLIKLLGGKRVLVDKDKVSIWLANRLNKVRAEVLHREDPSWLFRAKKNTKEIENIKLAHVCDGVALCEFLAWFDYKMSIKGTLTEKTAANKLWEFRKQASKTFVGFRGEDFLTRGSFPTIPAFGPNAEMAHYSIKETKGEGANITGDSLFLIDSGAQYRNGGTTDITRTVAVGTPSDEQKDRFTRVLKGHIALAEVIFPKEPPTKLKRTPGTQLDSLPRQFLWEVGLDYGHGTSHGIGSYLAVHESPGSNFGNLLVPLEEGMVLSNEPGYYKKGEYGIRTENVMLVVPSSKEGFLGFETISLAPIDQRLIKVDMLTEKELGWLNNYHALVFQTLSPHISPHLSLPTLHWLKKATDPICFVYQAGLDALGARPKGQDFMDILEKIRQTAKKGHSPARRKIANLLLFGGENLQDHEEKTSEYRKEAFKWASSIIRDDKYATPEDHDDLAMMYENGWGTVTNPVAALKHTMKAADPYEDGTGQYGWPDAQYRLSWMNKVGWFVEKDEGKSKKWFEIAEKNEQNENLLGMTREEYEDHFTNAAALRNSSSAAVYIAYFYETGRIKPKGGGDPRKLALSYYEIAQKLGERDNVDKRFERLKNEIENNF